MEVIRGWKTVPAALRNAHLAIGNFDGVHRGHQALIGEAVEGARAAGAPSGAVVFEPHPRQYFEPEKPFFRLTPLPLKLALLEHLGLEFAAVLPFGADMANLGSADFVHRVIVEGFAAAHVVVGYDFTYGKGRTGAPAELTALGRKLGFGVTTVEPVSEGGALFSSTRVRDLLRKGLVRGAAEVLGYWWRVRGRVEEGAGRGAGLGFPTANVALLPGQDLQHGIYAVRITAKLRRYAGAGYFGARPTFAETRPLLEVTLFDFSGDLYDEDIEVELISLIREDAMFNTPEELARQMEADCAEARRIANELHRGDPLLRFPLAHALEPETIARATREGW